MRPGTEQEPLKSGSEEGDEDPAAAAALSPGSPVPGVCHGGSRMVASLTVWSWPNYLTSQSLSFLIYKWS